MALSLLFYIWPKLQNFGHPNTTFDELTVIPFVKFDDVLFIQRDGVALQFSFSTITNILLSHFKEVENLPASADNLILYAKEHMSAQSQLEFR